MKVGDRVRHTLGTRIEGRVASVDDTYGTAQVNVLNSDGQAVGMKLDIDMQHLDLMASHVRVRLSASFPDTLLRPRGGRSNRMEVAKAQKAQKAEGAFSAKQAIGYLRRLAPPRLASSRPMFTASRVRFDLYFRDKRGLAGDGDNWNASFKYFIDGLQAAGLVTDDNVVELEAPRRDVDRESPRVECWFDGWYK